MSETKKLSRPPPGNARDDRPTPHDPYYSHAANESQAKIEIFGSEMVEKRVKACANSGRVYLPPEWIGHRVKIIRVD